jgi:ABC-type sugar transport system, periplasmic component
MNKKLKALTTCVAVAALTASVMTGCSSKKEETVTKVDDTIAQAGKQFKADKPVEFTMLFNDSPSYPYQQNWMIFDQIKKLTNVSLKLTVVPMSDYVQKRSLLISSGDAPEIMPKTYPGQEVQFVSSGSILPISDYVNQMPNYSKKAKDWNMKGNIDTLKQNDGKYYVLPGMHEVLNQDYSFIYRADVFEKNNIKVPDTYDELETALKKLKEIDPNSYPLSDEYQMNSTLNLAAPTFGATWGWNTGNGMMYDQKNDKFVFSPVTSGFKSMISYFSKLNKEGLLDPESVTQSEDQAVQKFVNGKSYVIAGNSQGIVSMSKTMDSTIGKDKYKIAKMTPLGGPQGRVLAGSRLENGVMLSAKAKDDPNFKQMLQFIDWLWYSDDGQKFCKWGVEGTTYQMQNGKEVLMPDITFQTLNPTGTKDLRKQFGFSGGVFAYGGNKDLVSSMMSDADKTFKDNVAKQCKPIDPAPAVPMDQDQQEQSTLISKPLMDYVTQMTYKFIIGKANIDTDWNQFVGDCKTKQYEKLESLTNQVYKDSKTKK